MDQSLLISPDSHLYFYDRVLVLPQEVNLIWLHKKRRSIASVIYTMMHASTAMYLLLDLSPLQILSCEVGFQVATICEWGGFKVDYALCTVSRWCGL